MSNQGFLAEGLSSKPNSINVTIAENTNCIFPDLLLLYNAISISRDSNDNNNNPPNISTLEGRNGY